MKKLITEKRILTNVHLTQHQKQALATIFSASSASLAYEHISGGAPNLMAAAKILDKLGMVIIHGDDEITVTEAGKSIMRDEGLLDDTDTLTDDGQKAMDTDNEKGGPEMTTEQPPAMESYRLIKEINFLSAGVNKH